MWYVCIQINSAGLHSGAAAVTTHIGMQDKVTHQKVNGKFNAPMFCALVYRWS